MTLSKEGLDEKALNFAAIEMAKIRGVSCDDEVDQRMFGAAAARIITAYLAALPEPDGLVERLRHLADDCRRLDLAEARPALVDEAATFIQTLQRSVHELEESVSALEAERQNLIATKREQITRLTSRAEAAEQQVRDMRAGLERIVQATGPAASGTSIQALAGLSTVEQIARLLLKEGGE